MKKSLPEDWAMYAYDDEIIWWRRGTAGRTGLCVTKNPFVFGFFVAKLVEDDERTTSTYPIAGPFRSLHTAIAAIALTS